jgi:hypothetical protein
MEASLRYFSYPSSIPEESVGIIIPLEPKRRLEWGTQHLLPVWENQGLKPSSVSPGTARLKPCPDTKHEFFPACKALVSRSFRARLKAVYFVEGFFPERVRVILVPLLIG